MLRVSDFGVAGVDSDDAPAGLFALKVQLDRIGHVAASHRTEKRR
jgi:hypothetical protein